MKKFHLKPTIFCSKIPKNSRKTDCYNNNIEKIEESNGNGLKKTIGICCAKCIFYKLKNNDSATMTARKGKNIHENFSDYLPKFKKIISYDYSKMLQLIAQMEERGLSYEQAQIEAFYAHKNQA